MSIPCGGMPRRPFEYEITARTEQYFCPIKHAHKIARAHVCYAKFLEYGEAASLHDKLETSRDKLKHDDEKPPSHSD